MLGNFWSFLHVLSLAKFCTLSFTQGAAICLSDVGRTESPVSQVGKDRGGAPLAPRVSRHRRDDIMLKNAFLSVSVKAINFLREMGNFVSVLLQLQHLAQYLENN